MKKEQKSNLLWEAIGKFLLGVFLVGALIFYPAGTMAFGRGWLLMGILFVPMFAAGLVMIRKNPDLLRRRLQAREKEREQDLVQKLSGLMFVAGFVLAGLDFRFGWSCVPHWVTVTASLLFLLAYLGYAEVLRENAYLSRTIEVAKGQHVVDTGLYGIVRHPMYAVTLLLFISMPLVLGSWFSLMVFLCYPALIMKRILNEEKVLAKDLPGYTEYLQKVRWRLLPFIW